MTVGKLENSASSGWKPANQPLTAREIALMVEAVSLMSTHKVWETSALPNHQYLLK